MKVAFRISKMGFGGAERVFLSVAAVLAQVHQVKVHFVVDRVGIGTTEEQVTAQGFKLVNLASESTLKTVMPLKRYLDSEKPDILISAYTDTNFGAIISAKIAKHCAKVIVSEHASFEEHWQFSSFKRRLLLKTYVKWGYRFSHHILAVSKGVASQLLDMGLPNDRVSCIYNPVRFHPEIKEQSIVRKKPKIFKILAVGRITKQKDYLTLLKAFKLLTKIKKVKLVIVGGVHQDKEKAKVDDYVLSHGLSGDVEFVGYTENVETFYHSADIFVLSSAWEGFGNVLVEALAFGLPIVSTNCNHGPAEILGNGQYGKLVPVGDSVAMFHAIMEVLDKTPFLPVQQKSRAKEFSESTVAEAYYQLFKKVMQE